MKNQEHEFTHIHREADKIEDKKHFVRNQKIKAAIMIAFIIAVGIAIYTANTGA